MVGNPENVYAAFKEIMWEARIRQLTDKQLNSSGSCKEIQNMERPVWVGLIQGIFGYSQRHAPNKTKRKKNPCK